MSDVAGEPVSAHDVAREIRRRLPGVPTKKLHKLCYLCQGHHLGTFGVPLFTEPIAAWDMGPVVGQLWKAEGTGEQPPPDRELTEAQLNTIGYTVSRYGANTGGDLEILTHNQPPWQRANAKRQPKGSVRIEAEWMQEFFAQDVEEYDIPLDSDQVRQMLAGAAERAAERPDGSEPDDLDRLRAKYEELARTARD